MISYREQLPQMGKQLFLTDGGLETTLIFHQGLDLPHFSAITLLDNPEGIRILNNYFHSYLQLAKRYKTGFILESATWRGDSDWAKPLGYSKAQLTDLNVHAITQLHELKALYETTENPIVISGCIGPRGDAYDAQQALNADEAEHYHAQQISLFNKANADMITALTLTSADEAVGIVRAAMSEEIPVVISFTLETDGLLPDGQSLSDAIAQVDQLTDFGPAYYMINCAHPNHFMDQFQVKSDADWVSRIHGIRANASCKSHAELDEATQLDDGDPLELSRLYGQLIQQLPNLNVFGGCCGTDVRHIEAIIKNISESQIAIV